MADDRATAVDLANPPKGCRFERTPGGFVLSASARSWAAALMIPFAVAWWSFLLFFVGAVVFGMVEGSETETSEEGGMPVLFVMLFLTPFFVAGLFMIGQILMSLFGRVVVTVDRSQAQIFTGLAGIGRRKRCDWDGVARVVDMSPRMPIPVPMPMGGGITLEGSQRIVFGRVLNESRSYFVTEALKQMLAERR